MSNENDYGFGNAGGYANQTVSYGGGVSAPSAAVPSASAPAGELIKDTTTADFKVDVIDASMHQPVLVDFWAPWCGPCRQLTPIIESAVTAAGGAVRLVKMNIDEHPSIAGQLGVKSIPAVFAFSQGRPLDGFMGALPESEIKAFIDKVLDASGASPQGDQTESDIETALEQAIAALAEGNVKGAGQVFVAILQQQPENLKAIAGLAECYIAAGEVAQAEKLLEGLAEDLQKKPEIQALAGKIELAHQAEGLGALADLRGRVDADPSDNQARFDLALALGASMEKTDRDEASELLVSVFKVDREWEDDGARKQLLKFFEAWGGADAATISGRRKLSAALFS